MEISLDDLYVDIGADRDKNFIANLSTRESCFTQRLILNPTSVHQSQAPGSLFH